MANTVVTSDTKKVKVVFNDLSSIVGMTQAYFSKSTISEVKCFGTGYVEVVLNNSDVWQISTDGSNNTLRIDTVDGETPTDNDDLCNKIAALMDY